MNHPDTDVLLVMVTAPSQEEAEGLATQLVEARLAACANLLPHTVSIFRWQGQMDRAEEVLMILKTTQDRVDELIDAVKEAHSYEVPEVLAIPVLRGEPHYLAWVSESVAVPGHVSGDAHGS